MTLEHLSGLKLLLYYLSGIVVRLRAIENGYELKTTVRKSPT